ncbi:MAG TPA: hypothetical protein VEQ60_11780, partial [Longimicrobium sp.]|nr:hypothetical protein [Longimicrobium sp.]
GRKHASLPAEQVISRCNRVSVQLIFPDCVINFAGQVNLFPARLWGDLRTRSSLHLRHRYRRNADSPVSRIAQIVARRGIGLVPLIV